MFGKRSIIERVRNTGTRRHFLCSLAPKKFRLTRDKKLRK